MSDSVNTPVTNLEQLPAPLPEGSPSGVWSTTVRRLPGDLEVGGCSVRALAERFGTPLYILDEADARSRAAAWVSAMREAFAELAGADVYYACKAFASVGVARWMLEEGLHLDTCSEGELRIALAAGARGHQLGLHGNNKSAAEIELALEHQVAHLVVDSLAEVELVAAAAAQRGQVAAVVVRVTSGIHAGGHDFIATAHEDQKFGLSLASGAAWEAIKRIEANPWLRLVGLHSHIGSQIVATEAFVAAARAILDLRARVARELGTVIPEIDLGGGYGVRYTGADPIPPTPRDFATVLAAEVARHSAESGIPAPRISVEPGRSIIAPAGMTLYTVGTVKNVHVDATRSRTYVSVDGGMSDNIRPALYGADYTAALVDRVPASTCTGTTIEADAAAAASAAGPAAGAAATQGNPGGTRVCRVVGKHCESGDIVVCAVALPEDIHAGDLLVTPATGAYGRVMASHYNMLPSPGVIAVRGGRARWLIRGETVADLLALDADYPATATEN